MNSLDGLYAVKEDGYFGSVRKEILPLLPQNIERVFEVGCGSGNTLHWLKHEMGSHWAGGVELCSTSSAAVRDGLDLFIEGNIENIELPVEHGSLDLVLCLDVLEHLIDPWLAVQKLSQIIKPGGAIIASIPNVAHRSALFPLLMNDQWEYEQSGILDKSHLRFFTRKTAVELMEQQGLKADKVESVVPMIKGSKSWVFDAISFGVFRRFFTTQYLVRAIKAS